MIKEYCISHPGMIWGVIRFDHYGNNLELFEKAYMEAKADFPYLIKTDITVVHYGGERYARTFGIEFPIHGNIPVEYKQIGMLEYTK